MFLIDDGRSFQSLIAVKTNVSVLILGKSKLLFAFPLVSGLPSISLSFWKWCVRYCGQDLLLILKTYPNFSCVTLLGTFRNPALFNSFCTICAWELRFRINRIILFCATCSLDVFFVYTRIPWGASIVKMPLYKC